MRKLLLYTLCIPVLAACMCTSLAGGGSGTNTGNAKVVGKIVDRAGEAVAEVAITLRPDGYLQAPPWEIVLTADPKIRETVTGSDGSFTIDSVPSGEYSIEANDSGGFAVLLQCTVFEDEQVAALGAAALDPYAAVAGIAAVTTPGVRQYVQVYGLERCVPVDSTGSYSIGNLPAGEYALRIVCEDTTIAPVTLPEQQFFAGETTRVPPAGWLFSKQMHLNTSATGADVPNDVTNFPVLVRLNSARFDFSQVQGRGEDLRFVKTDGTPLFHEIERWDSAGGAAEVWVRVDTVFGDNSTQLITMYWGNPVATDASKSAAVFDTAAGFQGVWHLAATGDTAPDATGNGYDGSGYFTSPVKGIIGNAQHFNGTASYIRMEGTAPESRLNFPMDGRYSVSAWVYHDTLTDSVTYLIAGKGELQYFLKTFGLAQSTSDHRHQWEFTEYHENDNWRAVTYTPAVAGTWTYIVGVKDGPDQFLYVNGELVVEEYRVIGTGQDTIPRDTTDDFSIGAFLRPVEEWDQGRAFFNGAIDEVGVASVARNADWVKLSYMNQKEVDALVQW